MRYMYLQNYKNNNFCAIIIYIYYTGFIFVFIVFKLNLNN